MSNLLSMVVPGNVRIREQNWATLDEMIEQRNPVVRERIIVERALAHQEKARAACATVQVES